MICAEQYASRLVVPQSQRTTEFRWASHKDHARTALRKLAAPHLPASLRQLRAAVERAHRDAGRAADSSAAHDRNDGVAAATTEQRGDDVPETTGTPDAAAAAPAGSDVGAHSAEE